MRSRLADGIDKVNTRFDKPWVWPTVGTVFAGALMAVAFRPAGWLPKLILFAGAVLAGLLGVWGTTRREVTVENLTKAVEYQAAELEQAIGELEVRRQTVAETRQTLDALIGRLIKRHCVQGGLTEQDRITWVLVSPTQLRVVGRGCHDVRLEAVNTRTYHRDHGLMGRAASARTTQTAVFDPANGSTWEQWQTKTCRLGTAEHVGSLTMRSQAYVVMPIISPDDLETLGVVVLESVQADTTRLEVVEKLIASNHVPDTIKDVLSILAQLPAGEDEEDREDA